MVFSSSLFLSYFLPIFLITYWFTPRAFKNITALMWSLLFYMWGAPQFIMILLISIILDFALVHKMARSTANTKKFYLIISLIINVGLLCYFKYANFFVDNVNTLLGQIGLGALHWKKLALPIGISFFTFQKISYVVDVYRGKNEPLEKITDLMLYIMLFPQLIAGPIVRYTEIKSQLKDRYDQETIDAKLNGLFRFSIGLAKKMLIANQLGVLADAIFNIAPESLTMGQAWLGAIAYAFQIYYDFSGYSDMAIGLGLMMGFKFPENFNAPYISQSITEFWRRWHITLSNWMKDYFYIPLGGNRVSKARMYLNLSLVFLISGFWHGAAWTFIAWGAFHGIFLILDRLFLLKIYKLIGKPLSILLTFIITLVGWVIFRSLSLTDALQYVFTMFDLSNIDWTISINKGTFPYYIEYRFRFILVVGAFFSFLPMFSYIEKGIDRLLKTETSFSLSIIKPLVTFALLAICYTEVISTGVNPFIYYRF